MVPIADTFDDRAVHVMMEAVDGRFWDRASVTRQARSIALDVGKCCGLRMPARR
jgi:hypothetical protein